MISNMKISLHNLLVNHYPNYTLFFKDLGTKTAQGFFYHFPSPEMVVHLTPDELTLRLKQFYKSVRKEKAKEILDSIKAAGWTIKDYLEERNRTIRSYIEAIQQIEKQADILEKQLDQLIEDTGYPLKSMLGIDTVLTATFLPDASMASLILLQLILQPLNGKLHLL